MKFVAKFAVVAAVALALVGCDDQAKKDLVKCQEDAQKVSAELTTVKAELDAAKVAATELQGKFDALTQEREALVAKVAELEGTIAAAAAPVAEPAKAAPKPAAKKPAEAPAPAPITTSTGVKAPTVAPKAKGKFQ